MTDTPVNEQVARYLRKTPVDAVQWTGTNFDAVAEFLRELRPGVELENADGVLLVKWDGQGSRVAPGVWAVSFVDGGFTWSTEEAFAERYELIDVHSARKNLADEVGAAILECIHTLQVLDTLTMAPNTEVPFPDNIRRALEKIEPLRPTMTRLLYGEELVDKLLPKEAR